EIVRMGAERDDVHLVLRNGVVTGDFATEPAVEVQNVDAFVEALAADLNELFSGSLKPCGVHPAFGVPDGFEALPIAGVTPQNPVVDSFADCEFLSHYLVHCVLLEKWKAEILSRLRCYLRLQARFPVMQ